MNSTTFHPSIYPNSAQMNKNLFPNRTTLLSAAIPLLAIMICIKNTTNYDKAEQLKINILHIINIFETQAKTGGYKDRTILAARYCLCTALDEAVLSTEWGSNSNWSQSSLLATVHKETWGGEKFYIILERMLTETDVDIELIELFYLIINLGFEGKYFNDTNKLNFIKNNLFLTLSKQRQEPQLPFSDYPNTTFEFQQRPAFSLWLIMIVTTVICFMIGMLSEMLINHLTNRDVANISHVSQ